MKLEEVASHESGIVEELRQRFKGQMSEDLLEDDSVFQRFLKARNHDLVAAETMLKNHIKWRNMCGLEFIGDYKPPAVLKKYLCFNFIGYDKEGSPIWYLPYGNYDCRGILKSTTIKEVIKFAVKHLEESTSKLKEQSEKKGRRVDKFIFITDFENLALSTVTHKPTIDLVQKIAEVFEANYPERLKVCYLINASFVFTMAWTLIKPFLSSPTVKKIMIYGKDGWQNDMLQNIDADVLPAFLGGNRTDSNGDAKCKSLISFGGPVPAVHFRSRNSNKLTSISGAKTMTINRMSKKKLQFQVNLPATIMKWKFLVKSGDIEYTLLYKAHAGVNSEEKQIFPKQRIEADVGIYNCKETGIYILEFDNKYSWMHSKEVHYVVSLVIPGNLNQNA